MNHAVAPDSRPTWFVVLAAAMVMAGGIQVGTGFRVLLHPESELREEASPSMTEAQRELAWQVGSQGAEVCRQHAVKVRAMGAGRIVAGLLMLYAAAAALMKDRRGRSLALLAAWLSLPYHASAAAIRITLWREVGGRLEEHLRRVIVESGKVNPGDVQQAVTSARAMLTWAPMVGALLAAGFSGLILWFFGGRRGRALYGLDRPFSR